ncbi:hypothetical protein AX15_005203 [Amanita polypyramis BW_CC]|nr:hypothetical protein AX15_005203 [Amanita polypyramis BW_CC]
MLRLALSPSVPRSFVSSVLLARPCQNLSLADLRTEARARGLSSKGNKATIVARIQQHDASLAAPTTASPAGVQVSQPESVPPPAGENGIAPGIPYSSQFSSAEPFLNIKLPDLTQPDPIPPVQIPYVPDFWDSSISRRAPAEQPLPKVLVVTDANAHHAGAPTHLQLENVASRPEAAPKNTTPEPCPPETRGIPSDIAEDLGLAPWEEIKKNWRRVLSL